MGRDGPIYKRARFFTRLLVDDWIPLGVERIEQTKAIQEFRSALDTFLAVSFRDLMNSRGRRQSDQPSAWDSTKKELADAVIRMLELDELAKRRRHRVFGDRILLS